MSPNAMARPPRMNATGKPEKSRHARLRNITIGR